MNSDFSYDLLPYMLVHANRTSKGMSHVLKMKLVELIKVSSLFFAAKKLYVNGLEKTRVSVSRISSIFLYYLICFGQLMVTIPSC